MSELSNYNLYQENRIYQLENGEELQTRQPIVWTEQEGDRSHIVSMDEPLDLIAYKYYNGKVENPERYWWLIAEVNQIDNPLDLSALIGTSITIPDVLALQFLRGK
jgi:hypothetical protein